MKTPVQPTNELQRLDALYSLNILDSAPEERFDCITRLASRIFDCPHATISLVDKNRLWFKSSVQLDVREIPRNISICAHTILNSKTLVIADTWEHPDFANHPMVTGAPNIRFYAGVPLKVNNAYNVATLCIIDSYPRTFNQADIAILEDLARIVESELQSQAVQDITSSLLKSQQQLQKNEKISRIRNTILELIVNSSTISPILNTIVKSVELEYKGNQCSILLLDSSKKCITMGAAPSLPSFYNEAIEGLEIGIGQGSCGTAMFTGERVVAQDIITHPYWVEFKELATKAHLRSCWSQPIKSSDGEVLGSFAIYKRKPAIPSVNEIKLIEQFAHLASIAIERQKSSDLIWRQANFDTLTDLPNRNIMGEHLRHAISVAHRDNTQLALMFLDLDNFKDINDTLGHSVGDDLLVECARRIEKSLRKNDIVARLGGDEFVIIITNIHDFSGIEHTVQKILKILATPYLLQNEVVHSSASIGITTYPADGREVSILLRNADQAMYAAKSIGKNNYHYYTQSMRQAAIKRMRLINDLRFALDNEQFFMLYQPIVDLQTGAIYKAEALLRWQHPTRGLIGPSEFIPLAEETGLIIDISNWVLNQVCNKVKLWRNQFCPNLQISINTSPIHYSDKERCITQWLDVLLTSQTPPDAILLEITESLLMNSTEHVSDKLFKFSQAGVDIALDDFGTGFSSISYLKKYPTDYLKIDQSFVHSMTQVNNDKVLCEAIIVMAKKLGIKVIAEGVETPEQQKILEDMGCDFAQGYLFSYPLTAEQFTAQLDKNS
ncbi:MAG: diguanylate cyclase (GGDEF)-like protein [Paraglaciecola sp.]